MSIWSLISEQSSSGSWENYLNQHGCPVCSAVMVSAGELRTHLASHVTLKPPFNCPVCQKTFSNKYNVQTHMVIHTGERPFKCDLCSKSFKQKSHMIAHKRSTHFISQ